MLKNYRVFTTSVFLLTASSLNAGFYAGAGIGSDSVNFHQRAVFAQNQQFSSTTSSGTHKGSSATTVFDKKHMAATGFFGTLFAGYQGLYKKFYYAAEMNGNFSSNSYVGYNDAIISNTNDGKTMPTIFHPSFTKIKLKNTFGLSILPGYQFSTATLFYGRLGWANSKALEVPGTDDTLVGFNKRINGFRYGLGIKQTLTDRVAVRLDYSRVNYDSITAQYNFSSVTSKNSSVISKTTTTSPNQELFELGLVWSFS